MSEPKMAEARAAFEQAVAAFRSWAGQDHPDPMYGSGEWECDYEDWQEIYRAVRSFLDAIDPLQWDSHDVEAMLYILGRANEDEVIKDELVSRSKHLMVMARAGVHSNERDARWQLADALGYADLPVDEVVPLLTRYFDDEDEYVSRRALLALGRRLSPATEALARRAWDTGDEYQRMAALSVLYSLASPLLPSFLTLADQDGRKYLANTAGRIRSHLEPR